MSTLNSKRNRGGRMNSGSRTDKRQLYSQDRQQRNRGQVNEKNLYIDGVYKNQRLTNVVLSMVGSNVQVQVKNGLVYEGIFKTCSPNGDIVFDYVHMVEDNGNGGPVQSNTPSKDRIIPRMIVKLTDLVSLTAANLDLDYAVKDSFTDAGISKYNGEVKEKEMRELQPWESEGGDEITLDGTGDKSSNGWDANDMFHTNAVQFNVQSSYDESLEQYTTRLERGNSEEYRRREQQASKLAAEIERCDSYKKHIALENGEGDDEEAAFSAVVRPGESSSQSQPTGSGGPGKYIPPNKRAMGSGGMGKSGRGGYNTSQSNRSIPSQQQQQQQQAQSATQVSPQSPTENINGEETGRPAIPASTAGPTVKTSPVGHDHGSQIQTDKQDHGPHLTHTSKVEGKKAMKGRDEQIKELKEFSSNFKLDENKDSCKDKDKEKEREHGVKDSKEKVSVERKESVNEEKDCGSEKVVPESRKSSQPAVPVTSASQASSVLPEEKHSEPSAANTPESNKGNTEQSPDKSSDIVEKSTLNPNAKEFNPNAKSFQPKQATQQQIPTPPRPQTQSPMNILNIQAQPVFQSPGQHFMMQTPHTMVLNNTAAGAQPQYNVRPKRAVVSVKPDYPASAVQAATGQPLLAQSAQPGYMYIQHQMMPPQPTGYQMGQVMPMPAANPSGQRFMTPTSVQGVQPSSMHHASGMEQNNPALQASQVYMTTPNQGPMPAHMSHASHFTHPNHIIMSNPNNQQPQQNSQINPPPMSAANTHHHPAPSPVHTNPNQPSMNPGPHPPSSGTPQPPQGYPQATLQAHPPLQASPHNPTSPQTMQQMHYQPYTSHGHPMQMQGSAGGQQFSSVPQQSSMPTSVTYSMQAHTHQSPQMQPQIVMMPPPGPMNNPHLQSQFQGHHPVPGTVQPQLMSQSGVQGLPGQTPGQGPHHQMQHYLSQVQHPGGQHVQTYQPSQ